VLLERQPGRNGDQLSELSVGKIEQRRHGYSRLTLERSAASSSSESLRRAILSLAVMIVFRLGSMVVSTTPSNPLESGSGRLNSSVRARFFGGL